jgi:hypothetical protein
MTRLVCLMFFLCASAPAFAVYKCELDGKINYRDTPCSGGEKNSFPSPPLPAPGDAQAARQRAQQEKQALVQLEKAQHMNDEREQKAQRSVINSTAAKKKACAALALQKKWREEDVVHASPNAAAKAKRRARRAAEKYEVACKAASA